MLSGLYVKLIGFGLAIAMVLGAVWYVQHLRSKNAELLVQNTTLTTAIKTQNDAVDQLQKDAKKREEDAAVALAAAQAQAAVNKASARVIYKTLPSTPGKDCVSDRKSALDLINGGQK